ncbi:hypothetical protein SBOR_8045 [Sclerotinia borealis F-4128]|uniref:Uncharacterized protein n=1 Tax=Sclerotinia borealis (strain F-4128) TaxID=1432307 RepID=W9CAH7_SCLBF|nr:hypothetical protein SBOR_8045 [Sclerotinia borealis F-4128]
MATEATSENFATPSITPDHELNTTETKSQDVPSEQNLSIDGITTDKDGSKQYLDLLEPTNNSAEVSVSEGSDTEATKAETSKIGDEKGGHVRSASTVKKPVTSFKAVSVNKTFLASKASTTVAPSKIGDKGLAVSTTTPTTLTASTSFTPKPRLVAKTGSGLRDSTPRVSTTVNGGTAGGAPDASAVWNKNRPAAPPEPKRFTDEELKLRYGIHLATRLQSDDPGKQANWADIDDDDDDWAPETIEWTDGTKITLPHADEAPPPPPEPVPELAPVVREIQKAEPAPKLSQSPTPQAIAAPAPRLGSGKAGLILKGALEKPTLVAKPPGPPTPVKSPWAQLPPVEKVAPVANDFHQHSLQQPQQSRFNQRDPHGFSGIPPPPAKEIAADDFSRTWRESNAHASRELYNSQSGRYEPVNDARRGVSRSDGQTRGPAVLQRPSHQDGPAEPSAAFQTHRAHGQEGSYGRRRTSSNVSGGSGNFARRMSRGHDMPPPHDMLNARRGSLAAVSDAPSSPRNFSPSGQHFPPQQHQQRGLQNQNQSWQSRASPSVSHPSPHSAYGQLAPVSGDMHMHGQGPPQGPPMDSAPKEDVLEEQKNIMKRTRELAIKRRQEAEAKEEAERKERIRIKLEAMGPPPEKKKGKDELAKEDIVPISIQSREVNPISSAKVVEKSNDVRAPKPDVANENLNARHIEDNPTGSDLRPNGVFQPSASAPTQQLVPDNRNPQSWQRNSASNYPTDRFTSWSAAPPPPQNSSSRIWGPPTNEKTIGNGTFNPDLNRLPEMSRQSLSDLSHPSAHPGPIGPPGANRGNGPYQANRGRDQYNSRPPPIGPPSANRVTQPPRSYEDEQRRAMARSVWGGVPDRISQEDVLLHQQHQEELERKRELEAAGVVQEPSQPVYEDTWKQVTLNEDGTRSKTKKVSTALIDGGSSTSSGLTENISRGSAQPESSRPQYNNLWPSGPETNASTTHRESKFFPNINRDIRLSEVIGHGFERSSTPSPPPPTMAGHPAYDSDFAHPHVALPPPLPVVRLPPPNVVTLIAPPRPQSFAAAAAAAAPAVPAINQIPGLAARQGLARAGSASNDTRRGPTPSTQTGEWKEKIDQLFGKRSPPRTHALAVNSSSRRALDHSSGLHASSATVSLPGSMNGNSSYEEEPLDTKPAAEECFEEQEMGSLPVIKIPQTTPQNAFQPVAAPRNMPRRFLVSDTTSVEPIQFLVETSNNTSLLVIMLPGQEISRVVHLPTPRIRSNPRRGRGGSRQASSTHPRGGRGTRDANSGPSSTPRDTQSPNPSNTSSRGRGGRGPGNNSNWNRHVATPVHT